MCQIKQNKTKMPYRSNMECLLAITNIRSCQTLRNQLKQLELYDENYKCTKLNSKQIGIPVKDFIVKHSSIIYMNKSLYSIGDITFSLEKRSNITTKIKPAPGEILKKSIVELLMEKNLWNNSLNDEIPKSWEKYDDLIVFDGKCFSHPLWEQLGDSLWKTISSSLKVNRVALKNRIQTDGFRTPNVKLVWGVSTWVNYVDNEIKYGWDVERNMFSAGNAPERHRLGSLDCRDEVVVDLFAGIGYFTLPFLVHAKAEMVHACEWNPNAVTALRRNLISNKVENRCTIHEGDNRTVCPANIADRVNLGLIPTSRKSWPVACAALKSSGGTLHIHENVSELLHKSVVFCELQDRTRERLDCEGGSENTCLECLSIIETLPVYSEDDSKVLTKEFFSDPSLVHKQCDSFTMVRDRLFAQFSEEPISWKKLEWKVWALHVCHSVSAILQEVREGQMSWKVSVLNIHHVKSYAPHVNHMVLDLHCSPVHL